LLRELEFLCSICPREQQQCRSQEKVIIDTQKFDNALKIMIDDVHVSIDYLRQGFPLMKVICRLRGFLYYKAENKKDFRWYDRSAKKHMTVFPEVYADYFIRFLQQWHLNYPTSTRENLSHFLKKNQSQAKYQELSDSIEQVEEQIDVQPVINTGNRSLITTLPRKSGHSSTIKSSVSIIQALLSTLNSALRFFSVLFTLSYRRLSIPVICAIT